MGPDETTEETGGPVEVQREGPRCPARPGYSSIPSVVALQPSGHFISMAFRYLQAADS